MSAAKKLWIDEGYRFFALHGPDGIKVEKLAKQLGRNKSAFYYFFSVPETFTSALLDHHLHRTNALAAKLKTAGDLQGVIEVFIEHKTDLLFNRQLRIHRTNAEFESCFVQTNQSVGDSIMPVWSTIIGLEDDSYLARLVLKLSVENFLLKITDEAMNARWLKDYFGELRFLVKEFKNRK